MVDTHLLEIHHIVRAGSDGILYLVQLGFQVYLTLLQPFEHSPRHLFALRPQNIEIFFYAIQFFLQNLLLHVGRLGYLSELVVRHDDTIPIVVLDVVEEPNPVLW